MFFSFDGIDGSGKSTQCRLFTDWLRQRGIDVLTCRDPGSTALGEKLRALLLDDRQTPIARTSEMLLYMAARAQLVEELIRPALAAGKTVVSDRFLLANVVYQGWAGGLDIDSLWQVGQVATSGLEPDLGFVLDVDLQLAASRLDRPLDRMEQQGEGFRHRLRAGFLAEARRRPDRLCLIDGTGQPDAVQAAVQSAAQHMVSELTRARPS